MSVAALCQALDIGRSTAFKMLREGQVSSLLLGRKRLITVESVEALIAQRQAEAREGQR
jgi:excisionase family DNA binding protein